MKYLSPLLFPILGNILAIYLVIYRKNKPIKTIFFINCVSSLFFGLFIALNVFCCSGEPSLWMMPLIFAPIEYWLKFGWYIVLLAGILYAWSKKQLITS